MNSQNVRQVLKELFAEDDPLFKVYSVRIAAFEGGDVEKLSACYALTTLYHQILGGVSSAHQNDNLVTVSRINGGNSLLPHKMAQKLYDRLILNKVLVSISKDLDGSYLLTFEDGQKTNADILVLALPCSVYSDINFQDDLIPQDKLLAIRNVPYGTNAKILVPFSGHAPKRVTFTNNRMVSFFDANCGILTLYYTGEASRFSPETLKDTYREERPALEVGFGDMCPPFIIPVFAQGDETFVSYDGPVGYSWPNDRFVKGSYSYIAPGQEKTFTSIEIIDGEEVKTLFAPLNQRLYFVGEHASVLMDVPGTMEAACESGERAARMIIKTLKKQERLGI